MPTRNKLQEVAWLGLEVRPQIFQREVWNSFSETLSGLVIVRNTKGVATGRNSLDNDQLAARLLYFTIRPLQPSTCFKQ